MKRLIARIWQAIRGWKGWKYVTVVRALVTALVLAAVLLIFREYSGDLPTIRAHLFDNITTDVISVGLTVLVIDLLNERRANRERKRTIIQQMGSPVNDAALEAVRLARREEWHSDGSLCGADLVGADLQRASLYFANLQGADLGDANLSEAHLEEANLCTCNLSKARMIRTSLERTQLVDADLEDVDLGSANLQLAQLQGAYLPGANLQGAFVADIEFDEYTALPDGTKWTPDTDMSRFTDPTHPQFWRSDDPSSPAYKGKKDDA